MPAPKPIPHISARVQQVAHPSEPPPFVYVLAGVSGRSRSTELPLQLQATDSGHKFAVQALLDSGATGCFIDGELVLRHHLTTKPLPRAVPVYNVDGTLNHSGGIRETVDVVMHYGDHSERVTLAVCSLGRPTVIVGHTWLHHHNPEVDWRTGDVEMSRCPSECNTRRKNAKYRERKRRVRFQLEEVMPDAPEGPRTPPPRPTIEDTLDEERSEEPPEVDDFVPERSDRVFVVMLPTEEDFQRHEVRATATISSRLAEEAHSSAAPRTFEDCVPEHYRAFRNVFSKEAFDELPIRKPWDHAIELKPGSEPRGSKVYPLSLAEQRELDIFLQENLDSGRIHPSKSPMASPVFFVKKKDGSLRLVQDYRRLNAMTVKNAYPLPLISELITKLRRAKYFTKLDIRWGFNNVRVKEGDEWKAAFRTNRGLFEPLVMFFGLCNSPSTFQTMMNDILRDLIDEGVVVVYLDDILIFTETLPEHHDVVRRVLAELRRHKLYLKAEKCEFERTTVEYLGLVITHGHVGMDPVKVRGVSEWPEPRNVKEVQSFVGFCNFYRRFIRDFSDIARPLHALTKKDVPWGWGPAERSAFLALQKALTSAPVLVAPRDDLKFHLETDASNFATGAILSQMGDDGALHPIAYMSKGFSPPERNYDVHDKELLAIIRALEEWRHFLEGSRETFEILTDHKNLEYFQTAKSLNRRQARWSLFLSRFDFTLHHRPGRLSGRPDSLSRRADHSKGAEDNRDVIVLTPDLFIRVLRPAAVPVSTDDADILRRIRDAKELDKEVEAAMSKPHGIPRGVDHAPDWQFEEDLVLYRGRVYVPKDEALRRRILELHHDVPVAGHPGRWKTLELVSRNYWWPGISRYVDRYVKGCDACNRTKTFPGAPAGPLLPNEIPDRRWQVVTVDLITELPVSNGKDAIFVAVDRKGKRAHFAATTSEVNSLGIARIFRDQVWKHHGLPEVTISDRGPQFVSHLMRELSGMLGISIAASTAYHPQSDGQTERVNQEVEQFLRLYVNHLQDDWEEWLPIAEFAYNNRIHSSSTLR